MDRTPIAPSSSAVERVRAALAAQGHTLDVTEFAESTATANEAAAAIGTTVGRIVKSLVFMAGEQPIMVLASGSNRVDLEKLGKLVDGRVRRASADEVQRSTSFAIGGVPPIGHAQTITTFIDQDLLQYDEVWAAAGTPNAVFPIHPKELVRISGARKADVAQAV